MLKYVWALLMAYLTVYLSDSWHIEYANFFAKFIGFVVVAIVASFGFVIGEKVRDFAMPDFVVTDGRVSSLIKTKLFWVIGLQLGASFVAAVIAALFFFKVFGPSPATYRERYAAEQLAVQEKWKEDHPQEAARQAQDEARKQKEEAAYAAQQKADQAREALLNQSSSLQFDFAEANMACESAKATERDNAGNQGIYDYQQKKYVNVPPKGIPAEQLCAEADALLEQIRQKGVCLSPEYDRSETTPQWVPCTKT